MYVHINKVQQKKLTKVIVTSHFYYIYNMHRILKSVHQGAWWWLSELITTSTKQGFLLYCHSKLRQNMNYLKTAIKLKCVLQRITP